MKSVVMATSGARVCSSTGRVNRTIMMAVTRFIPLLLWASLVSGQTSGSKCAPIEETDWNEDEMRGRVKTVQTYKTWFTKNQQPGVITASKPELEEEATYDPKGNQISWRNRNYLPAGPADPKDTFTVEYGCDRANRVTEVRYKPLVGPSFKKTVYSYDEKGHNRERADYSPDGTLERLESYAYDDNENLREEIARQHVHPEHFVPKRDDVYITTKTLFEYDTNRNKTKEQHLSPDGSLYATWIFKYDPNNRMIKHTRIDKVGRLQDQFIYKYDRRNRLIEERHYANFCYQRDDQMCKGSVNSGDGMFYYLTRTTYEYDRRGNWINQRQFSMGGEKSTRRYEPDHLLSRRISYY